MKLGNSEFALIKNLLAPLFLMGCFTGDCQEGKRPIKAFGETAHQGRKRPIKEGKRPVNANGQFLGTLPWWKTAPLKRPIEREVYEKRPQKHHLRGSHSDTKSPQGKTPWVDPACADCPGFLVLSAAPAPASTSVSEPQIVHLD